MAKAFMAFMYEDEILEKFSAPFVTALMYRVALWIAKRYPQAKSKPPDDMGGLDSHKYYDLGDVAVFLVWALFQLACS